MPVANAPQEKAIAAAMTTIEYHPRQSAARLADNEEKVS
jgi:hypothetical protein